MRFDYQPAYINLRILTTYKQKRLLLFFGIGIIGCLIIFSSIAHNLKTQKQIEYNYIKSSIPDVNVTLNDLDLQSGSSINDLTNQQSLVNLDLPQNANFSKISDNIIQKNSGADLDLEIKATPKINTIVTSSGNNLTNLKSLANIGSQIKLNIPKVADGIIKKPSVLDLDRVGSKPSSINTNPDHWHEVKINPGENLVGLLKKLSISNVHLKDLQNFIKSNKICQSSVKHLKSGSMVKVLLDQDYNLQSIILPLAPHKSLFIDRIGPKNYKSYYDEKPIIKKLTCASNKVGGSFYGSAQRVGLNEQLIMEVAEIFGWDIDFSIDLRPSDTFKVVFEEKFVDQQKIGVGNILAAEFINQGRKYRAVRFIDRQGVASYYTPEGYSMTKTFLRNPVKFTRIGSKFSMNRHHPILHRFRAHKGVDYVAPAGTPVKAAGDGRVIVLGRKGGYGNVVELLHGNKYSTLYAHLSNFSSGLKKGQFVKQGQIIGYVGRTGLATGDHLHYEFRVDGIHRDPLTVQLPRSLPLANKYKTKFLSHAQQMLSLLDGNESNKIKHG